MNAPDNKIKDELSKEKKLTPFGGYYSNRVPGHDPEITESGPGTPLGEYMRRFWQLYACRWS